MRAAVLFGLAAAACGPSHRHGPTTNTDPNTLFVEVSADGDNDDSLRAGARTGLRSVRFARFVETGGELELQTEVSRLDTVGGETRCGVKILAVRLPEHDLLGIADGAGRASGTDARAGENCVEAVTAAVVRSKVRVLLQKRLAAKR